MDVTTDQSPLPASPPLCPPASAPTLDEGDESEPLFGRWAPIYHVPGARTFDALFSAPTFGRDTLREGRRPGLRFCYVDARSAPRADDEPHVWFMDVRPAPAVAAVIQEMVSLIGDEDVFVEITLREDGSALALAKYNRILGSRWLAEIDPASVPRPPRARPSPAPTHPSQGPDAPGGPAPPTFRRERLAELLGLMAVQGDLARFTGGTIDDWDLLKGAMLGLGAKWVGGKTQAFRFGKRVNVIAVLDQAITTGRITNEAREAHFVASPLPVARRAVRLAHLRPGERVLEPSAGQGGIADVVRAEEPRAELVLCELLEDNRDVLVAKGYGDALAEERDFMRAELGDFDAVVMNPPFKDEIAHVTRAFGMLREGGRLVSIMSGGIAFHEDAATRAFRAMVTARGGTIEPLPDGSFRASGTDVSTVIVYIPR